jgi:hypothetical protein
VELCTAVKGQALIKFLEEGSDKVVYLDPDIEVFHDLQLIDKLLDTNDVLLTPHQTVPEEKPEDVLANEICSMQHGVFNFGFYAVKNSRNGLAFARWWRDRLQEYCFDDIPFGLFTDQRWGDMAPTLFDGVYILRDPGCNVSTWNLTHRAVTKTGDMYYVNGQPLLFYHFSGLDSGAQKNMLDRYGKRSPVLYEMRENYLKRMKEEQQEIYGNYPSVYNFYDNHEPITKDERLLLRKRVDLTEFFQNTNPYHVAEEPSYYTWYREEMTRLGVEKAMDPMQAQAKLEEIYASRSWKIMTTLKKIKRIFRR